MSLFSCKTTEITRPCPCRSTARIRHGTIFEQWQRISLSSLFFAIHLWANKISYVGIHRITGIPKRTTIRLCQVLRECFTNALGRNPIRVGGNGQNFVVQIDETQVHHRQQVCDFIFIFETTNRGRIFREFSQNLQIKCCKTKIIITW